MVGVRIDIDTLRDTRALPVILNLLEKYGIKASFFVTTGVDETYRNFRHYLNPLKLLERNVIRRYGLSTFSGLLTRKYVQRSKELHMILEKGHELGLHGYSHFEWMNYLGLKSKEEITSMIQKGCELFEETFGFYPECFAAPGFRTSPCFLEVLEDFGFKYSSDFMDSGPFYPALNGCRLKTLQVPVSLALGEHDDRTALDLLKKQVSGGYAVFYLHPSYEPVFRGGLIEKVFEYVSENGGAPLGEMVN